MTTTPASLSTTPQAPALADRLRTLEADTRSRLQFLARRTPGHQQATGQAALTRAEHDGLRLAASVWQGLAEALEDGDVMTEADFRDRIRQADTAMSKAGDHAVQAQVPHLLWLAGLTA